MVDFKTPSTSEHYQEEESPNFLSASWQRLKNVFKRKPPDVSPLDELTINGIARFILNHPDLKIIVMTGAGMSTAAGIPDFRSPNSGLYANMGKYNLPHPQAMFEIHYFKYNPEPFFALAKELLPIRLKPTVSHYFLRLLFDKNYLLRTYTQNIDSLENMAGIPEDKIVNAHGSFNKGHCMHCRKEFSFEWLRTNIEQHTVPRCDTCHNVVKPDVVLFGEGLPSRFFSCASSDFPKCDMLIIMGTSLVVQPFASLVSRVKKDSPRLLVNLEKTGSRNPFSRLIYGSTLDFDSSSNFRDVFWQGTCDDGCIKLAKLLGWEKQLQDLVTNGWQRLETEYDSSH